MPALLQTMREGAGTQHPEEIINFLTSRFVLTSGIWDSSNNEFLVEESDTPAMSVDIRQGFAFLRNSSAGMVYPVRLATEDATLAISSNSSGNSRIDAIVLYQDLGASPNAAISNVAKIVAVEGTPAASPSAPDATAIQTAIGASNPYTILAYVTVDSGETTILDADISDQRTDATYTTKVGSVVGADGWAEYSSVIPTRSVSDDPTYEITFAGVDLTGTLQAGMRVKWTQNSTVRYGIITKVALDGSDTDVTIYGGTDYDVDDTASFAISGFYYSNQKAPFGFPLDPDKWSVIVEDNTDREQNPTVAGTWYNLGSGALSINIPIGVWRVEYQATIAGRDTGATDADAWITLSDANNTESDDSWTCWTRFSSPSSGTVRLYAPASRFGYKNLTTKDTFYLNLKSNDFVEIVYIGGALSRTIIRATCAYL